MRAEFEYVVCDENQKQKQRSTRDIASENFVAGLPF